MKSPVKWMGGKSASAEHIVSLFPDPQSYNIYVEPCGGAMHVLLAKPHHRHTEIYNDLDDLLVNFWQQAKEHGEELQQQLINRPYARKLYYDYWHSLYGSRKHGVSIDTSLSPMEKATRWLYILRGNVTGYMRNSPPAWDYGNGNELKNAAKLIQAVQERIQDIAIDNRDAVQTIERYSKLRKRVFFYVDPPYVNAEHYYPACRANGGFDHEGLAQALNACPHPVAVSYYPHPMLDNLYPTSKWQRQTWQQLKSSNVGENAYELDIATEMLLCNYEVAHSTQNDLWGIA